ncbi:unnamed protein product [Adineta steineri]|uniref:EGF-like domain-containing protein n=1 Tax=Adineta steineri TaxID=433720 RepID=A0A819H7C0_9BILA|nr:unnamed protein product [Adineta steineri]CAF3897294.1 unnamed protein product [Adineta steineri]
MISQILSLSFIFIITVDIIHAISITKQGNDVFQLLKDIKERVKHGTQCLPPSKYFAGSCYTYMKLLPAKSWDEAYNNCLSLPLTKDARLLVIDSVAEYDFVERELIGPKSGSDSVSVYVGLRKINDTWLWSNDLPLKETPVYRFWIDTNKDILAYDCGALWLSKNSSILTAAACAEQSSRPYVCKYTVDRCFNNSGGCGKYGTCLNLPLLNSHKCNCRFLYAGERCEKWSDQGVQAIIGGIIVIAALIISFIISMDRSSNQWSFKKDAAEHYQAAAIYGQSRPTSYMPRSPHVIDRVISNPCSPQHEFFQASTPNEKHHRFSSSSTPPPIPPPIGRSIERKHRYSFRLSIQELEVTSHIRNLFIKPKRIIFIILPIVLTIIISIIILHARHYIKEKIFHESFNNSTRLFQFCALYDNNYYVNLVTLPIAVAIILLIIFNESRITSCRLKKEKSSEKFSIYTPIPFNPFSKVNRFDTMILCGIVSHEILQIIEEIFLKATQMKLLTMRGPLYDLIRQIGLVVIIGMRYYPVYTVVEMTNANVLYYALCAVYMWIDLIFRILEQSYCVNIGPIIKTWHKFQQFKNEVSSKMATSSLMKTTMAMHVEYEDSRTDGIFSRFSKKIRDHRTPIRQRTHPTTIFPSIQSNTIPSQSLNWSSIYLNFSSLHDRNESQSTFEQFNISSGVISVLKYAPYYLCLSYICLRLSYLFISKLYLLLCCNQESNNSPKQSLKHIYHEPDINIISNSSQKLSVEYRYVRHLLQKTRRILFETNEKISFIKSLLYKIYRPNKYFHYSKQILNMYIIAFMLTYYLTFNILQAGFYIIEKLYSIFAIPLLVLTDELDLPHPQAFNLKYEMIIACFLTAIVYYGQLLWGMKSYQKHMIDSYKGIFIDIPPRTAFKSAQLISKHAHYPGYCLAYLGFAYISLGNIVFITIIILRVLFKQIFLVEQVAKVLIPILVLYLLKFILMWFLSRTFFLQKHGKTMALKNLRAFFIFNYFNFFFDCFLGIVSCSLRVTKASIAAVLFLPRLDYCIFGRTLEKMDSGFISYVSFIHMECLHTHPVLVYYCSLVCEKIERREQYLRSSKREMRSIEMEAYKRRQRAIFRWWLGYTLIRNTQLTQLRKHQVGHLQLQSAESFNEFLERKFFNRFQLPQTTKFTLTRSRRDLHAEGTMDSNTIIRNNTTACTTLLLDVDEHDDRKPGF